jgi:pimeloyl-ACP methyl ester carboxylesterase
MVCTSPGGYLFRSTYQKEAIEKIAWEFSPPEGMSVGKIYETLFDLVVYPDFFESNKETLMSSYSDYATSAATLEKQYLGILKHDTVDRLDSIEAETIVIHGDSDKLLYPKGAECLSDNIPNAILLMIENASHYVLDEKWGILYPKLLEFLG